MCLSSRGQQHTCVCSTKHVCIHEGVSYAPRLLCTTIDAVQQKPGAEKSWRKNVGVANLWIGAPVRPRFADCSAVMAPCSHPATSCTDSHNYDLISLYGDARAAGGVVVAAVLVIRKKEGKLAVCEEKRW